MVSYEPPAPLAGHVVLVNFTIDFVHGGPPVEHMRSVLHTAALMRDALAPSLVLADPYTAVVVERVNHRSNDDLALLSLLKVTSAVNVVFVLAALWGLVVFWTITARGQRCRSFAHSEWRANFVPTAETIQVFVQSSFPQLIMALVLHKWMTGTDARLGVGPRRRASARSASPSSTRSSAASRRACSTRSRSRRSTGRPSGGTTTPSASARARRGGAPGGARGGRARRGRVPEAQSPAGRATSARSRGTTGKSTTSTSSARWGWATCSTCRARSSTR